MLESVSKSNRVALYGENFSSNYKNKFSSSNNISRGPRCFVYNKYGHIAKYGINKKQNVSLHY